MLIELLASLRARLLTTSSLAQETTRDGQTLTNGFFQSTVVDTTPAFLLDNDFARFLNFGEVVTNGAPAAVSVTGENAQVFNFRSGSIEALNEGDVLATGIQVSGSAAIRNFGEAAGAFNGIQFAGADSTGTLDNFRGGVVSSDSRAVDIQGTGVTVRNFGDIVGTGAQRNGTIYTNDTAENVTINNLTGGTIDAGVSGAGISFQVGDEAGETVSNTVFNGFGATIQGRGQAASDTAGAGDGIRINNGAEGTISETDIVNSGLISSESNQGTAGGIRIADGAAAEGRILNTETGSIDGARNGLYIGQADHDLEVFNFGTIQSGSRAVNIDGTGVELTNAGDILGTSDQRNGTVYGDGTADDFSVRNLANGTIDAGDGNLGSGFAAEIGSAEDGANTFSLENDGLIQGRGNGLAATGLAGDGARIGNAGNSGTFDGTITNRGEITSEGTNGTVAGLRVVDQVNFQGALTNAGSIAGIQNGVYFGTGDHTGGRFTNELNGIVSSGSRALNIDGEGLDVVNDGEILGTGNQRNGTVYADGTADNYTFNNTGTVDAGLGNNGSGVSLQTGDVDGDVVSAAVFNEGTIQGRGDAEEGNQIGDGLRLFSNQEDASFAGLVQNDGHITASEDSDAAAGIRIDGGLNILGAIVNNGEVSANLTAVDATEAGSVTFVNDDEGIVNGDVLLGAGDDIVIDFGQINGVVDGGAGDDVLIAGDGDNLIVGGLGNDFIDGGDGFDTVDYSDADVAVSVNLGSNGNGTSTRDAGFTVRVDNQVVSSPAQFGSNIEDGRQFVEQALEGNLYFNIHTSDFLGGEIRGQLTVVSDTGTGHGRVIELAGPLDAAQEPGPFSDSTATGDATLTIRFNEQGEVVYSSELSVLGLNESDLQSPIPGVVSAIHLHNAPAGQNGPVVQDTLIDAGATLDVETPISNGGILANDVFENQVETDVLTSIENVIGSGDDDVIIGSDGSNFLQGGDGDDVIRGEGGNDILDGGEGSDIFSFDQGDGIDLVVGFELGVDKIKLNDFGPDFDLSTAVSQDGADAVVSFSSDTSVRLEGIDSTALTDDDFIA